MELFEQLGIAPVQILINMVGFLLLLAILRKFLYTPILNLLEQRQQAIQADRTEAARHRQEMEQRSAALEQRLAQIETEVRDRMQAAEREAQRAREELLEQARSERAKLIDAGLAELRREREKVLVEMRDLVADLSIQAAAKIIERELDLDAHRAMVDDLVEHGVR